MSRNGQLRLEMLCRQCDLMSRMFKLVKEQSVEVCYEFSNYICVVKNNNMSFIA